MKLLKKIGIIVGGVAASIGLGAILAYPILAEGESSFDKDYMLRRTLAVDVLDCYAGGHMVNTVALGDRPTATKVSDLANNDNQKIAAVPTDFISGIDVATCRQLFEKKVNIIQYGGLTDQLSQSDNDQSKGEFLQKLGYAPTGSTETIQCSRFNYTGQRYYSSDNSVSIGSSSYDIKTQKICGAIDGDGNLVNGTLTIDGGIEGLPEALSNTLPISFTSNAGGGVTVSTMGEFGVFLDVICSKGENFNGCIDKIYKAIESSPIQTNDYTFEGERYYIRYNINGTDSLASSKVNTEFALTSDAGSIAAKNLLGRDNTAFLSSEVRSLYQIYLNESGARVACGVPDDQKAGLISSGYMDKKFKLVINGKVVDNCYATSVDKTYNGFTGDRKWSAKVSFSDIIDFLASDTIQSNWLDYIASGNAEMFTEDDSKEGGGLVTDADTNEVNCFNAAGSLGWILCPVIEFAQHTINAVYGSIVENFLEFRATWLDFNNEESGGKKVYTAWQTFQSFANVVFVVVLLVVIFSQLTGVGIDNLGIKRVLPKLIIAAVLINLSYLICMLFVDISNILGVGVNGIFSNIVVTISESGSSTTGAQVLTTVVTGAVAGAVGFLALNPVSVGIVGSVVVVPLVLGLIATLIGILFFFILLGARQAAIIMLVVVSPIAFACYMLPNTKTIFDKWLKIFEALLLLFPICGLMMGGSAFASKVLQTVDNGFLGQLIAMLVGVVPFFFIPTLLRGAFSAMGNLGAKISGVGQNISRGLGKAAANSDTMKDFQTRMRAGVDRNGNLTWAGRKRGEIARGESRLSRIPGMERMARRANARSTAEYMKYQQEMSRQNRLNDPGYRERFERSQEMALEKEQFATEMDIVNDQTNKGNLAGKTYDIFNSALGEYNAASTDEERKAASFKMKAAAEVAGGDSYKAKDFIKRMKEDSTNGKLSGDALQAVAKQISTGDNRKNYRATDALGFEYMSQIANGDSSAKNADGSYKTYEQWASDANNVHQALENHVAESNDLMNQSTDSLSEIYRRVRDNGLVTSKVGKNGETIQINDRQTIANLARAAELKSQSGTGKEDVTKNPYISSIKGLAPESGNNADMQPGQSYDTRDLDDGGNAAF